MGTILDRRSQNQRSNLSIGGDGAQRNAAIDGIEPQIGTTIAERSFDTFLVAAHAAHQQRQVG